MVALLVTGIAKRTPVGKCSTTVFLVFIYFASNTLSAEIHINPTTPGGLFGAVEMTAAGDSITLSPGRYTGPENRNITLRKPLTIQAAGGAESTVIDCEHASRCLTVTGEASGTKLRKLTFLNGGVGRLLRTEGTRLPPTSESLRSQSKGHNPKQFLPETDSFDHDWSSPEAATVGAMLSRMSENQAAEALSQWLSLSNAVHLVSALPLEVVRHPMLVARIEMVAKEGRREDRDWPCRSRRCNATQNGPAHMIQDLGNDVAPNVSRTPDVRTGECAPAPLDIPGGCSGSVTLTDSCGSLTESSAGRYSSDAACQWIIDPPETRSLLISFSMLDVESASRCKFDYVSLTETHSDGQRLLGIFCGELGSTLCGGADDCSTVDLVELHVAAPLIIGFASDGSEERRGFDLSWQSSDAPPPQRGPPEQYGGCLLAEHSELTLDTVHIRGGLAESGGGLALFNAFVSISASEFSGNSARFGGALFGSNSSIWIEGSQVSQNLATSTSACQGSPVAGGAGMFLIASEVSLVGSVVDNNVAETWCDRSAAVMGGGIYSQLGNISVVSTQVENNAVFGRRDTPSLVLGGGMYANNCSVRISSSQIDGNSLSSAGDESKTQGGGIFSEQGDISLTFSNVSGNLLSTVTFGSLMSGGGVCAVRGAVYLASSRVENNFIAGRGERAVCQGGGIYSHAGSVIVSSSFVYNNSVLNSGYQGGSFGGGICGYSTSIIAVESSSTVNNNIIMGKSLGRGGGIYCHSCPIVTISSSSLSHNNLTSTLSGCMGGGLYRDHPWFGTTAVSSSRVCGNVIHCSNGATAGGGIYSDNGVVSVTSSHVSGNINVGKTPSGGGIFQEASADGVTAIVSSHVSNNSVIGRGFAHGGGLFVTSGRVGVSVFVSSSQVKHNSNNCVADHCRTHGGGIYTKSALVDVRFSNISNNAAHGTEEAFGGGVYHARGNISLKSSLLSSNSLTCFSVPTRAVSAGGGLFCDDGNASVWAFSQLVNNTVSSSWAAQGGGIFLRGTKILVDITVSSCSVSHNVLRAFQHAVGGGIYSLGAVVDIAASSVSSNSLNCETPSSLGQGGGVYFALDADGVQTGSLSVSSSEMSGNSVRVGHTAQGGGIFAMGPASTFCPQCTVSVSNSNLSFHEIRGEIVAEGGAVWVSRLHGVFLQVCSLWNNSATGASTSGGGMYVTEAKTFMHGITLLSNSVTGPVSGEGGALSAVNGELRLNRCEFRQNSAETGGGLLLRGSLLGEIQASRIELNYVRGMGGGAVLQGGVSLHLANVHMLGNRALLISDILAAGSGILLSIFNSTFESKALLIGLVQGALVQLHNSSVWVSRVPGAAFVPDLAGSESSEIIRFEVCPSGSYLLSESSSVNRVGCSSCPTGAYCAGGASVYARRSHWGWLSVTSELTMARCPEGYCCANTTCFPYNFCRGNRAGFLCGVCADGYSEVLGSPGCQKDDDCTHFRWLLPVLLLISGVFVFVVLFLSKRRVQAIYKTRHEGSLVQDNGGEHKVIVFFFQCLPLVVSAESLETQSQFTQVLLSVFNLNFSNGVAGQTENSGWCPFIGFSVAQKITSRFIFPGLCLGWLVVFLFVEKVLMRFHTHDDQQYCGFGAHVAAFFVVFGVAYSSLVQATFDLVDCAALPGRLVWFPSAGVECFQSWQFLVLGTAVPILALWPTFLVSVVHRVQRVAKQRQTTHVGGEAVLQQLSRPYDRSRQVSLQWESVLMLQRLVLVTVSVFIVDANWRPWTLIVLLTVMLAVQTAVQPFAREGSNLYFSGCYCVLLALASWEMGLAVYRDRGWPSPTQEFRPVLGMFTLTPLCIGCLLAAQQPLMSLRTSLFKSAPSFFRAKPSAAVEFGTLGAQIDGAEDLERVANAEQVVVVNWLGEQWEPEETDGAVAC